MDPLSDVLSLLRVRSLLSARIEVRGPWALRFSAQPHMKFAGVLEGSFWLWTDDGEGVGLERGDFYLLTQGQAYCTGSDRRRAPSDGRACLVDCLDPDGVVRLGSGDADLVSAVGGRFVFDDEVATMLLRLLPPVIHVSSTSASAATLRPVLEILQHETAEERPGGSVASISVANLVLVEIIRAHLASDDLKPGWLGALSDPAIASAVISMHEDVAHPWTIEALASRAGLSRTTFTERFKARVGLPPLTYLLRWRMALARAALARGESLSAIAGDVGYGSDSAFSAAYTRTTGQRPGRYRSDRRA